MRLRTIVLAALVFTAVASADQGFVELPASNEYLVQSPGATDWGRVEMVQALRLVAHVWSYDHPNGPEIQFNDLSLKHGGKLPPHVSHQHGLDVDVVTRHPNVFDISIPDAALARELLALLRRYGANLAFWNGDSKGLSWVQRWKGHDDHTHVRFAPSVRPIPTAILDADRARGVTPLDPLLRRGDQGDAVRELQALLVTHGAALTVDGVFGSGTDDALRAYQKAHGLGADGVAGPRTWLSLRAP